MRSLIILATFLLSLAPSMPALAAQVSLKALVASGVCGGNSAEICAGHFVAVHGCGRESV